INFLDIKLLNDNGSIIFNLYKKPTDSGRFLNFFSNHPTIHKKGVGLLDKILFLSHPKFQHTNIDSLINTLLRNGYPLQFLFKTINNRIKTLSRKKNFDTINEHNLNSNMTTSTEKKKFFTIPYLKGMSEKFNIALNKFQFELVYKPMNNLNRFIKTGKDKIKKKELSNVVYQINCKDCDYSYVGQTKRKLKTRLKEHINDLKKPVNSLSVISNHRIDTDHAID
ncbi:hypothetical protein ALC56_04115, partial [Trachymyrmex septentrionalis]